MHEISLSVVTDLTIKEVKSLYLNSFPIEERRPIDEWVKIIEYEKKFSLLVALDSKKQFVGFISYWLFSDFIFAEHFAVLPNCRNLGYGSLVIKKLLSTIPLPLILEVELPDTETACKRIGFYQRLGFRLWNEKNYIQPALAKGQNSLPMFLMTYGNLDLEANFDDVKNKIYQQVYQQK